MTTFTPNILDTKSVRAKKPSLEEKSPLPFKEVIRERGVKNRKESSQDRHSDQEEDNKCTISIFELPRHHFSSQEEEESAVLNTFSTPLAASSGWSNNTVEEAKVAASQSMELSAEIATLFEKMAGTMLILASSRETETTFFLDSPQFHHSVFYGTRITIKEFSTAPKAFNIAIGTSALALAHLEANKSALLEAFEKGNFNFSIGRLDTEIEQTDRPLFHRKEAVSQDEEDPSP